MKPFQRINICCFTLIAHKVILMKSKMNKYKILAAVVVVIFAVILAYGIFQHYHFKASFVKLSDTQISEAKSIAIQDLESRGENASDYKVNVMPEMRRNSRGNQTEAIAQVSFTKENKEQFYLIDLNSDSIMMRSQTEHYGNFTPQNEPLKDSRWFHTGFMPRNK